MSSKIKVQIEGQGSQMKRSTTPKTRGSQMGQMSKSTKGKEQEARVTLGKRTNRNRPSSSDLG